MQLHFKPSLFRFLVRRSVSQHGMTLIEVMVAIVVLSIGLLGIAGMQAATSKYKINTWARASISTLVSDLSEKIRINASAAGTSYAQNGTTTASSYFLSSPWATQQAATLAVSKNCETTVCTATERASFDLESWRISVRQALPQGAALIGGDRRDGISLTLMWFDKDQVDPVTKALIRSPQCSSTDSEVGMAQQSCCPTSAEAPEGGRCARFSFVP